MMQRITEKLAAFYPFLFTAGFLGLLLAPLLGFRGDFVSFEKSFWGYKDLLRGYVGARLFLLQDQVFEKTWVGSDGWLVFFDDDSLNDYQNAHPFSESELAKIQQSLDGLDSRLKAKGIRFLVVLAPSKNTIYPEYVPAQVPVLVSQSRIDQLVSFQREHGTAQILDLRPTLREASRENPVFYRTDSHWNQYGIYAGYRATLEALHADFPALEPHLLGDYKYVTLGIGSGDLGIIGTQRYVQEITFELRPRFERQAVKFTITQANQLPGRVTATHLPEPAFSRLPSAFVYHDSFGYGMIPFLADHFRWAIFDWNYKIDEGMLDRTRPDIVILEVTEIYLSHLLTISD